MSANAKTRQDLAPTLPGHAGTPIVDPGPNAAVTPSCEGLHNGLPRRGEGERSVHLPSGMNESMNHSFIDSFQRGETVESVLLRFGVFALSTAKRQAMADLCGRVGVDAAGLSAVLDYVSEGSPDAGTARRYMASIVSDEVKLADAWKGVRAHRETATAKDAGPAHMVNMPIGTASCSCSACRLYRASVSVEPWDHDRQSLVAACLAGGDRWPLERVAEFFGVSLTTAAVMVERGRVLKTSAYVESLGAAPLKKKEPVDDAEERAKQFRNGSRAHRLQLLREAIPTREEAQG